MTFDTKITKHNEDNVTSFMPYKPSLMLTNTLLSHVNKEKNRNNRHGLQLYVKILFSADVEQIIWKHEMIVNYEDDWSYLIIFCI